MSRLTPGACGGAVLIWALHSVACLSASSYGTADLSGSWLVLQPGNVALDGNASATVWVHVARASGQPVNGVGVALQADQCTVTPAVAQVDATGLATLTVGPCANGLHTARATVMSADFRDTLSSTGFVNFYAPVPDDAGSIASHAVPAGQKLVLAFAALGSPPGSFTGALQFASSDSNATLPPTMTLAVADHGRVSVAAGLVLRTPGTQTVTVLNAVTREVLGSQTFVVASAGPRALGLSVPTALIAGHATSVRVQVEDVPGHLDATFAGTLHFFLLR